MMRKVDRRKHVPAKLRDLADRRVDNAVCGEVINVVSFKVEQPIRRYYFIKGRTIGHMRRYEDERED